MQISLIVAAARNGTIGVDGGLPWHLPDDFAWFKQTTMGKPIVMGRKTWESIGKPLPGRLNIVMTRDKTFEAPGATVVSSPALAAEAAGETDELMIIGGEQIYAAFLPQAARVYLTRVDADVEGDAHFPALPESEWLKASSKHHAADERHAYSFDLQVFERR